MSTNASSGHAKNVANLGRLVQAIDAMGAFYNPANPDITVTNLKKLQTDAEARLAELSTALAAWKDATNKREIVFKDLSAFCKRIKSAFDGFNTSPQAQEDVGSLIDQIAASAKLTKADAGRSAGGGSATTPAPGTDPNPPAETNSPTKHIGFDEKTNLFGQLVDVLLKEPIYKPNETELTIPMLQKKLGILQDLTKAVTDAEIALRSARITRNTLFYGQSSSVLDLVKKTKAYIKSLQGNGQVYKTVSAIHFKRIIPASEAK